MEGSKLALCLQFLAVAVFVSTGSASQEIANGQCGNVFQATRCLVPGVKPGMKLQLEVAKQLRGQCVPGQNAFLKQEGDQVYIVVNGGCLAVFSVKDVSDAGQQQQTDYYGVDEDYDDQQSQDQPQDQGQTSVKNNDQCGYSNSYRIVGGTKASDCEFPWMVMLFNKKQSTVCGGSIIDETHILTAAHCFFAEDGSKARPEDIVVMSGSSAMPLGYDNPSVKRNQVTAVHTHERYNTETLENDIAILKLARPLKFDQCQRPICLVDSSMDIYKASGCRVMGWGLTSNDPNAKVQTDLQWVSAPVVSEAKCKSVYPDIGSSKTFCAGSNGKDSCSGDSGGPYTCRQGSQFYIYGIVSAGIQGKCGGEVGIYTKVSSFLSWVQAHRN